MKKQVRLLIVTALISAFAISCDKTDGVLDGTSLKLAVDQSAMTLNRAVSDISSTQAFTILTVSSGDLKSATVTDPTYKVNIPLEKISGVYEYKPVNTYNRWGVSLMRYFNRTADDSKMIVKMPLKKVKSPMSLRHYSPADSTLTNNFQIAVSDYHNNYNNYFDYDYLLASEISIDNAVAGELNIRSVVSPVNGKDYASQYAFTNSYTAEYKYTSGDTIVSSFGIKKGTDLLYEEKLLAIKNDTARFGREHQYILTIGNVQIIRNHESKTVQIAVNGVVQPNAKVEIIDKESDPEASVCKKREVQITFEDGTTATISSLIGASVENIRTLYKSLHQVYFAAYVVDWIAYDIYYGRN
jgi:hypothetical protein